MFTFRYNRKAFSLPTLQEALDAYGRASLSAMDERGPYAKPLAPPRIRWKKAGVTYVIAHNGAVLKATSAGGQPVDCAGMATDWSKIAEERRS